VNRKELLPTEVLAGVLACLHNMDVNEIPSRQREIHSAIYDMREGGKTVLKSFRFDTSGIYPYSPTLEQATSNLATSLLLERNNPRLNRYLLTERLKNHFENNVKHRVSNKKLKEINSIASYVRDKIKES